MAPRCDSLCEQEWCGATVYFLLNGLEAGRFTERPYTLAGAMVYVAFHASHADVVNQPSPGAITIAIDQDETATGLEHTEHFSDGIFLVGVMVKAVRASQDVKLPRSEWQTLAVSLDRLNFSLVPRPPGGTSQEHSADQIYPPDISLWENLASLFDEYASTAADIENLKFSPGVPDLNPFQDGPVGGTEEQRLKNRAVVATAPPREFLCSLLLVIPHGVLLTQNNTSQAILPLVLNDLNHKYDRELRYLGQVELALEGWVHSRIW